MRKIAATYIFPVCKAPIKNGILVCEEDGTIIKIVDNGDQFREEAGVEFYSGFLVPGFVDVNCNLQNHNKVSNRKMWANGIALAADLNKLIYVISQKNNCQLQQLSTFFAKNKVASNVPKPGLADQSRNLFQNNSVLLEMLNHQEKDKQTTFTDLLNCACLNGAKILGLETRFGSFEIGKNPGVSLITGVAFREMKLTSNSKVKRLV